jgi:hypothetical protein
MVVRRDWCFGGFLAEIVGAIGDGVASYSLFETQCTGPLRRLTPSAEASGSLSGAEYAQ